MARSSTFESLRELRSWASNNANAQEEYKGRRNDEAGRPVFESDQVRQEVAERLRKAFYTGRPVEAE